MLIFGSSRRRMRLHSPGCTPSCHEEPRQKKKAKLASRRGVSVIVTEMIQKAHWLRALRTFGRR